MTLYLREDIADAWQRQDPWKAVAALKGEIFRDVPGRRTLRFTLNGRNYYLKHHTGVGWREIIKNLLQARLPVVDASNEYRAIRRLQALGVPTMQIAAYGVRGGNPARRESFIITDALDNTDSLESLSAHWREHPLDPVYKRRLIDRVADIARTLHTHGVCHRDFYLCHFLLHLDDTGGVDQQKAPVLSLIDLHRALIKPALGLRWVEKDIAGLYYSAVGAGLTRRDFLRFIRTYTDRPLRRALYGRQRFWRAVQRKGKALASRDCRKQLRALYRSDGHQTCHRRFPAFRIVKKSHEGPDMRAFMNDPDSAMAGAVMLKDGDSTTVVRLTLDGRELVVKRYNIMGVLHGLKRLPQPSRAWRCWGSAHVLLRLGIHTPAPVAMIEKRWGPLRRKAWLVTEYIDGEDALQVMSQYPADSPEWQHWLMQFSHLFSIMRSECWVHGDMKATNFLLTEEGLVVLDLDGTRRITDPHRFGRRFNRDLARFLKNWEQDTDRHQSARALVQELEWH